MRDAAHLFATALAGFWLLAATWAWQHPVPRDRIEPVELDYKIDVNAADAPTLELLPGIGPAIARNAIAERDRGGSFETPADLERVHRIGPDTARRIAPWVRFDGDTLPTGRE